MQNRQGYSWKGILLKNLNHKNASELQLMHKNAKFLLLGLDNADQARLFMMGRHFLVKKLTKQGYSD